MEIEKVDTRDEEIIEYKFNNLPPNFEIHQNECFFLHFTNEYHKLIEIMIRIMNSIHIKNIRIKLPENIEKTFNKCKNLIVTFTQKSELLFQGLEQFIECLLKQKKNIEYFELNVKGLEKWHKLEESEVIRLCKIVEKLNCVKQLYLYFDGVSDDFSEVTVQQQLEMVHLELSSQGIKYLYIHHSVKLLQKYRLAQRGIGQEACQKIAQMIQIQENLKHLSLNLHNWGTETQHQHPNQGDLLNILKQIPKLQNLESLFLCIGGWKSWGQVRDIHMGQYMNELKKIQGLKALLLDLRGWASTITDFWQEVFTDQSTIYLEEFLETQQSLQWLSLVLKGWGDNNSHFTGSSIMTIGNALRQLENLWFLRLDLAKPPSSRDFQNKYSAHSLVYMLAQTRKMKSLSEISIKLPDKCMIPSVKRSLLHISKVLQNRKNVCSVLQAMQERSIIAQIYRKEIIQGAIVTIFGHVHKI